MGFEAAEQARLFLPFERSHAHADAPGQGLGLAIALAAAQRHQGRLWAQSEPGQGATFLFTLAPAAAQGELQVTEVVIDSVADQVAAPTGT